MSQTRYQSDSTDASSLGQPLKFEFSGKTARNRFLKASTTERLASWSRKDMSKSGIPTESLKRLYEKWGEGEYGVILSGNIMVAEDHLEAPGNMIIPDDAVADLNDERFAAFCELATRAKAHGSLLVAQLNHPGRQTRRELQPNPLSASDVALDDGTLGMAFGKPHAASEDEIAQLIARFTKSAEFLYRAGWDGVQLHAAHGYLLAQFLAHSTNKRTDQYGGSMYNRARLTLEIAKSIASRVPSSFSISVKLNSVEFQDGGFSTDEAGELCALLEREARLDFVELSGGTYQSLAFTHQRDSTRAREAFFIEFADQIAPSLTKTRTYVTGGFRTVAGMVKALETVQGVGIARAACQEPLLCRDMLEGKFTGVLQTGLDQENFMLTNVAAGTQLAQIGRGDEPMDLSARATVSAFLEAMGKWVQQVQEDKDLQVVGYVDFTCTDAVLNHAIQSS